MNFTLPGKGVLPSAPTPKAPPEPVDRMAIAEEAAKQRAKELRQRRGKAATILTSEETATQTGPITRPTLLGQ